MTREAEAPAVGVGLGHARRVWELPEQVLDLVRPG
jgi:hypothetical protein